MLAIKQQQKNQIKTSLEDKENCTVQIAHNKFKNHQNIIIIRPKTTWSIKLIYRYKNRQSNPPANSITLNSQTLMCNFQDTSSIIVHPPDTHPISYGLPSFWFYEQYRKHRPLAQIHQIAISTLHGRYF